PSWTATRSTGRRRGWPAPGVAPTARASGRESYCAQIPPATTPPGARAPREGGGPPPRGRRAVDVSAAPSEDAYRDAPDRSGMTGLAQDWIRSRRRLGGVSFRAASA